MSARKYSPEFKAKVAIEAIKGEETTSQIASRYGIHLAQVRQWRREVVSKASSVFDKSQNREKQRKEDRYLLSSSRTTISLYSFKTYTDFRHI